MLNRVDYMKICTREQMKLDVSEMHQRTRRYSQNILSTFKLWKLQYLNIWLCRLYEQLEEVKHQKAIRNRQEVHANNRLKAKEFHKVKHRMCVEELPLFCQFIVFTVFTENTTEASCQADAAVILNRAFFTLHSWIAAFDVMCLEMGLFGIHNPFLISLIKTSHNYRCSTFLPCKQPQDVRLV